MFHLAAWSSVCTTAVTTDLAPVNDSIIQIQNSHFVLPEDMDVVGVQAMATNLQRARFNSPSIRQINPNYIRPISGALVPITDPNIDIRLQQPFRLKGQEEIAVEGLQNAGADQRITVVAMLMKQFRPAPPGDRYAIRFTGATTLVVNTWTAVPITFETSLPVGRYAVVGCEVIGTTVQGFQLVFDNQFFRPGGFGIPTALSRTWWQQLDGRLGLWGEFRTISLPRLLCLANAADTAQEGYLQVVRIGN